MLQEIQITLPQISDIIILSSRVALVISIRHIMPHDHNMAAVAACIPIHMLRNIRIRIIKHSTQQQLILLIILLGRLRGITPIHN